MNYDSGSYCNTVTIPVGVNRVTFEVPITDDKLQGNGNFTLSINPSSLPNGVTIGNPGQTTVVIMDNDNKRKK